jgi:uncharacterized protein (TIGR02145 family)
MKSLINGMLKVVLVMFLIGLNGCVDDRMGTSTVTSKVTTDDITDEPTVNNTNPITPSDTDGDGINDSDETNSLPPSDPTDPCDPNPNADMCDADNDGLTNKEEDDLGTGKTNPDTDGDGINDGDEITQGSDPKDPCDPNPNNDSCDEDDDGLSNPEEGDIGTDPKNPDTDGDGIDDGQEEDDNTDPKDPCDPNLNSPTCDKDFDGLTNEKEDEFGTDRDNPDTDGDGIKDGDEVDKGSDPKDPCDPDPTADMCDQDKDGLINKDEDDLGTIKTDPDTDDDGINDGDEVKGDSDPNDPCDPNVTAGSCDRDKDGLTNDEEKDKGTDPTNPDTDGDGVIDSEDYVDSDYTGLAPCLPEQKPGYSDYDNTNELWTEANCDDDDYINGTEDNSSLNPSKISDPYDTESACFVYNSAPLSSAEKNRVYCEVKARDNKIWLDRNLGAEKVCETSDDSDCFGDYYQWGRSADGHEGRYSSTQDYNPSRFPYKGSNKFELSSSGPRDWLGTDDTEQNSGYVTDRQRYWGGEDQNDQDFKLICPIGWHVPTKSELDNLIQSEGITDSTRAFQSTLKLPTGGFKDAASGVVQTQGDNGYLWSTDIVDGAEKSYAFTYKGNSANWSSSYRAEGMAVRCLKD